MKAYLRILSVHKRSVDSRTCSVSATASVNVDLPPACRTATFIVCVKKGLANFCRSISEEESSFVSQQVKWNNDRERSRDVESR